MRGRNRGVSHGFDETRLSPAGDPPSVCRAKGAVVHRGFHAPATAFQRRRQSVVFAGI